MLEEIMMLKEKIGKKFNLFKHLTHCSNLFETVIISSTLRQFMTIDNPASKILNFDAIEKQILNFTTSKIGCGYSSVLYGYDSYFDTGFRSLIISLKNLEKFGSIYLIEPYSEIENKCCYIFWENRRITNSTYPCGDINPGSLKDSYKITLKTGKTFDTGVSIKERDLTSDFLLTLGVPKDEVCDLKLKLLLSINETISKVIFEVKQSLRSNSEDFIIGGACESHI